MKTTFAHFVMVSCVCVLMLGIYALWYHHIESMRSRILDLETQIVTKSIHAAQLSEAKDSVAEMSEEETRVKNYFVTERDVPTFITTIEQIGKKLNGSVKINSVAKTNTNGRPTLTFGMKVSGTFDTVMRIIGAIEYAPYNLTVTQLGFTQGDKNKWDAPMTVVVSSVSAATSTP